MTVDGLDKPCAVCERPAGDHTLREWSACLGTVTTDLPYEDAPDDSIAGAMRGRLGLDRDTIPADHIHARAATYAGSSGPVEIRMPVVLLDFSIGQAGAPPVTVAKIAFLGDRSSIRGLGRLVRDTANGAVRAAEAGR